jgi:hypothetical protein
MALFRCVAAIPNSGGRCIEHFYEDNAVGRRSAEAFAREHDRDGMGVYDCVSPLREQRRTKDNVALIEGLHVDIDCYKTGRTKEDVVERLQDEFNGTDILSRIHTSGRGIHGHFLFREPIKANTPEAESAQHALKRLIAYLGADSQPSHFAALMRRLGTINSKEGGGPCKVLLDFGTRCEVADIESFLDLVDSGQPLFTQQPVENDRAQEGKPVLDAAAELAGIKSGEEANAIQTRIITSMIWKAMHPDEIIKQVLNATMRAATNAGLNWERAVEEAVVISRVKSQYQFFASTYDPQSGIPVWLPMEFHSAWSAALAEGKRPAVSRNGFGWHIRSYAANGSSTEGDNNKPGSESTKDEKKNEKPNAPFILRPFEPFDVVKLPQREFLFGKHYQRRTVSGTVAPGGTEKSSLVMVEAIVGKAAGRGDLLGEEVKERRRVWYHNGEDNMIELQRRVAGICQHYNIPQDELIGWFFMTSGTDVPLRVAEGWNGVRIQFDHRLIKCVSEVIGDNRIDAADFDPLVTLHGVSESNPGQMDQVIRIFTRIADVQNCAIDLSHHTRKLLAGATAEDYTVDDMRGAKAISDAMRSVRLLNIMNPKDAEAAGIDDLERSNYFRIDRAKANYSAPSKKATWRQFQNVDLPNGDNVGVVVPWTFPGAEGGTAREARQKAKHVFLEALRRRNLEGRYVGEKGNGNAPHEFAREREAKAAKVSKSSLATAMRELFEEGKIRLEEYTRGNRHAGMRIVEV